MRQAQLVDAIQARKALLEGAACLDVREQREFDSAHIEGAIHIPLGSLEEGLGQLPKDRPVLGQLRPRRAVRHRAVAAGASRFWTFAKPQRRDWRLT